MILRSSLSETSYDLSWQVCSMSHQAATFHFSSQWGYLSSSSVYHICSREQNNLYKCTQFQRNFHHSHERSSMGKHLVVRSDSLQQISLSHRVLSICQMVLLVCLVSSMEKNTSVSEPIGNLSISSRHTFSTFLGIFTVRLFLLHHCFSYGKIGNFALSMNSKIRSRRIGK